jgi:hypothetical protein
MKGERRQPTRREWAAITSRKPVVRKFPRPKLQERGKASDDRHRQWGRHGHDDHSRRPEQRRDHGHVLTGNFFRAPQPTFKSEPTHFSGSDEASALPSKEAQTKRTPPAKKKSGRTKAWK